MLKSNEYYGYKSNLYLNDNEIEINLTIIAKTKKQAQELCFKIPGLKVFDRRKYYRYNDNNNLPVDELMKNQLDKINKNIINGSLVFISKGVIK